MNLYVSVFFRKIYYSIYKEGIFSIVRPKAGVNSGIGYDVSKLKCW
jgi:hypothetical protein